jgi:hypothetical protein
VQRAVRVAVAAFVEPMTFHALARRSGQRRDAAQVRERSLRAQPLGVVAGGDQQLSGGLHADAELRDERWCSPVHERAEVGVEFGDLGDQFEVAAGELLERQLGRRLDGAELGAGTSARRRGSVRRPARGADVGAVAVGLA